MNLSLVLVLCIMSATVVVCDAVKKKRSQKEPEPLLERIPKTSNEKR